MESLAERTERTYRYAIVYSILVVVFYLMSWFGLPVVSFLSFWIAAILSPFAVLMGLLSTLFKTERLIPYLTLGASFVIFVTILVSMVKGLGAA
ncbi:hypothetical protein N781_04530 [Pontibacillus halophilus JSM 076056 = DSM 19796]|uniref:Uncharacterized protein n=1 Tax=Pontibacillus halophilus JSM 076056 = DSM 19796 TaxID=1385510 RepID=A0A0A5GHA0_9BACI|nr:hypothetical protein [Pontibacillus halophilus]KGX91404.1 hypothetical protein N781_04530 [Pontibacillus halophilus JSM 076056 = DSM 19796]